jgi:hypothetical protein
MGARQGGPLARPGDPMMCSYAPYQGSSGRRRTAQLADQNMLTWCSLQHHALSIHPSTPTRTGPLARTSSHEHIVIAIGDRDACVCDYVCIIIISCMHACMYAMMMGLVDRVAFGADKICPSLGADLRFHIVVIM